MLPPGSHGVRRVSGTVLLIGTFDTKAEEYAFVRSAILTQGCSVLAMDIGVLGAGTDVPFPIDVTAEAVALAGGVPLAELRSLFPQARVQARRVTLAPPLARAACRISPRLYPLLNAVPLLRTHALAWIEKPR